MFEAIIAICIAKQINGAEVNPCWMSEAEVMFRTHEACRKWGDSHELDLVSNGAERGFSVVAHVACGPVEKNT